MTIGFYWYFKEGEEDEEPIIQVHDSDLISPQSSPLAHVQLSDGTDVQSLAE